MERTTTLTVTSPTRITLHNAQRTATLVVRDGQVMFAGKPFRLTPEKQAELDAAIAAYRPEQTIEKYGYEMTEADRAHTWEFVGVVGDAHGRYRRTISDAVLPVVMIGKMDLA